MKEQHPETYTELFDQRSKGRLGKEGLTAVVISGAAEPLLSALVRCAIRDVGVYFNQGRKPDALKDLDQIEQRLQANEDVSTTAVLKAITRLAEILISSGRSRGILIVVDELGKFLEYAARTQSGGDIFALQQLAEATNQSTTDGLCLVTILHQSFERYASDLRQKDREEWAKVQGRFEDVAFQEPPEQLLELISRLPRNRPYRCFAPPLPSGKGASAPSGRFSSLPQGNEQQGVCSSIRTVRSSTSAHSSSVSSPVPEVRPESAFSLFVSHITREARAQQLLAAANSGSGVLRIGGALRLPG